MSTFDLNDVRRRLRDGGPRYWRCLEELAEDPEFLDLLGREFPREAALRREGMDRREFVALLGASLALAGLAGCTREPSEKIVPFVRAPEGVVPGKPLFYATASPEPDGAVGLLVKTVMGRPIKVEGNPKHPASLGAADRFAQASLLSLYDPDRSQAVLHVGRPSSWSAFQAAVQAAMSGPQAKDGAGLRILTETVVSPTLSAQIDALLQRWPAARWHSYEPVGRESVRDGARLFFGQDVEPIYHLDRADVLVSLDADLLDCGPGHLRHAREFADRRREGGGRRGINRLYSVESSPALTGAAADHRFTMAAGRIEAAAWSLARAVGVKLPSLKISPFGWVDAVARDLRRRRGASLVAAGPLQPPVVHALAHAMNEALGSVGATVTYLPPAPAAGGTLQDLARAMEAGDVRLLLILGGNPVYTAPADLNFATLLDRVALRVHLGCDEDETSQLCHWHLPEAHFLESWGDARAVDGTVTILQPTIAPLYGGRTATEVLSALTADGARTAYEIVRAFWKGRHPGADFETFWSVALHEGSVAGTAAAPVRPTPRPDWAATLNPADPKPGLEAIFRPDPTIGDGRHSNNAWLQELPKPLTHLTWDNAAQIGPAAAQRLQLANGDRVEVSLDGRRLEAPVWVVPGHPDGSVTLPLGYGRTRAGRAGNRRGFNAYALRTTGAPGFAGGLEIRKTGRKDALACTQLHYAMEGRELIRSRIAGELPDSSPEAEHPSLYPPFPYPGPAWGMVIDLGACTGCNACVVACQAENNIPVVGKEEVLRGREMQWIRVDRYYAGDPEHPTVHHQPVPCMHCEKAPCEPVCPVGATVHSVEGLNQMVYNRCVGTRYCQNNCPYKVRRFNFFDYAGTSRAGAPSLTLLNNPDVSVRERGVMEKCTYCVQRIVGARIEAEKEGRPLRDGEVVTACAASCPAQAITFGDLSDRRSRVARLRSSPLNYELLGELNTRPRTTYLEKVSNPNPELLEG
jgi:molybdopterin-containing oxidoreductase family iron-sulfur binding subunit